MARFKVKERADVVFTYYVDADTEEQARHLVEQGDVEFNRREFEEYEIFKIVELTDDDNK